VAGGGEVGAGGLGDTQVPALKHMPSQVKSGGALGVFRRVAKPKRKIYKKESNKKRRCGKEGNEREPEEIAGKGGGGSARVRKKPVIAP